MEEKFIAVWAANREKAESLGVRMRPIPAREAMKTAHRALSGSRLSDGFNALRESTVLTCRWKLWPWTNASRRCSATRKPTKP